MRLTRPELGCILSRQRTSTSLEVFGAELCRLIRFPTPRAASVEHPKQPQDQNDRQRYSNKPEKATFHHFLAPVVRVLQTLTFPDRESSIQCTARPNAIN